MNIPSSYRKNDQVMVEGNLFEDDIYIGRTYGDAPKVDGLYFCRQEELDDRRFFMLKLPKVENMI